MSLHTLQYIVQAKQITETNLPRPQTTQIFLASQ